MNKTGYKTLTNREVLTALLEGKEIQEARIEEGEKPLWWEKVMFFPFFAADGLDSRFRMGDFEVDKYIYRIKPETKAVRVFNGIELPDCITEPLEDGQVYFAAYLTGAALSTWENTQHERYALSLGLIYLNREDAEIHHKALTTYEVIEKGA